MGENNEFEEIRPYNDEEVRDVIDRLVQNQGFYDVLKFVHPDWSEERIRHEVSDVNSIADFQVKIAHPAMRILINSTVDDLTFSGLENIGKDHSYLFISSHRDIILDSAILNIVLLENGYGTIQTAIGSNLLSSDIVTDLTKLNKNFVVKRNTGAREFYENSRLLSAYIEHTLNETKNSIWIAQREGRTKDGLDKTQPGLLKMLTLNAGDLTIRESFRRLRLTPVAISYEYDPCDVLKIPQLKAVSRDEKYEKSPDEDFISIITGLTGNKGRVHLSIGKTINKELDELAEYPSLNDKLRIFGDLIDQQIYQNYHLWPTNYMALDLLEGRSCDDRPEYEGQNPKAFAKKLKEKLKAAGLTKEEDYNWLLTMYANPVRNHETIHQERKSSIR